MNQTLLKPEINEPMLIGSRGYKASYRVSGK
jgi:hypothetical protein